MIAYCAVITPIPEINITPVLEKYGVGSSAVG
jgi:hypothetical protein